MRKLFVVVFLVVAASLIPAGVAAERLPTSNHGGDPFSAVLSGHGSGSALVTLNPGQNEVCWQVTVAGLTAPVFASHIHKGCPYVNVHTSCGGQPATCGPFFPGSAVRGQLTHP